MAAGNIVAVAVAVVADSIVVHIAAPMSSEMMVHRPSDVDRRSVASRPNYSQLVVADYILYIRHKG